MTDFALRLKDYVNKNTHLVSKKDCGNGLYVLKYKKKVFWDSLWNEYLEECRGTIVDEYFNIVSYPFTKIYNYGIEDRSPVLEENTPVIASVKINGFMGAITWHNDCLLYSTTGSIDSKYVDFLKDTCEPFKEELSAILKDHKDYTFLFECVHPEDPHIIKEEAGLYLLGVRRKEWGSRIHLMDKFFDSTQKFFPWKNVKTIKTTVGELVKLSKHVKHEGFVAYTEDGVAFKIKSPHYLISKFVARNPKTDKLMRDTAYQTIDEEYYPLLDKIRSDIDHYTALTEQERLEYVRKFLSHVG